MALLCMHEGIASNALLAVRQAQAYACMPGVNLNPGNVLQQPILCVMVPA